MATIPLPVSGLRRVAIEAEIGTRILPLATPKLFSERSPKLTTKKIIWE